MKTFFSFLLLAITLNNGHAFTLSNSVAAAFKSDEITVDVASHACNNLGISNADLLSIIDEGLNKFWNEVPTSRLRMKAGGLRSVSSLFQTDVICQTGTDCTPNTALLVDGGIVVSCNTNTTNFTNSSVLAVTVPNNIEGREIKGALILINDRSDNQFQSKSHNEKVAIIAHEIGHAIGLGHSPVEDSLMHFRSSPTREALGWDDIDGVTYLYPSEQPVSGCGSINFINDNQGPRNKMMSFLFTFLIGGLLTIAIPSLKRGFRFKNLISV